MWEMSQTFVLKWRLTKHISALVQQSEEMPFGLNWMQIPSWDCTIMQIKKLQLVFVSIYMYMRFLMTFIGHWTEETYLTKEKDNPDESLEEINIYKRNSSLVTSMPKKKGITCDKYIKQSQCEDCYLDAYVKDYTSKNKN